MPGVALGGHVPNGTEERYPPDSRRGRTHDTPCVRQATRLPSAVALVRLEDAADSLATRLGAISSLGHGELIGRRAVFEHELAQYREILLEAHRAAEREIEHRAAAQGSVVRFGREA